MILLFRETAAAYFIGLFSAVFFVILSPLPFAETVLPVYLWIIISTVAVAIITQQKVKRINSLLYDCDISNFLAVYQGIAKRRIGKANRTMVLLNITSAHLTMGNYTPAGQLLYDIGSRRFPKTRIGAAHEFVYHNGGFIYCYDTNDIPGAARALEQMGRILQTRKLPRSVRGDYHDLYLRQQRMLDIANGNYDGADGFFIAVFEKEKRTLHKVAAQYTLGKIYLHQGKLTQAEQAFAYAATYGSSSIFRTRAIEQLKAMGKAVCPPTPNKPPVKVFSVVERAAIILCCCVAVFAAVYLGTRPFSQPPARHVHRLSVGALPVINCGTPLALRQDVWYNLTAKRL